jgi:hypothetical protein
MGLRGTQLTGSITLLVLWNFKILGIFKDLKIFLDSLSFTWFFLKILRFLGFLIF